MDDVRKRSRQGRSADDELQRPLLDSQQEDAEPTSSGYTGHDKSGRALVPHSINRFDWEALLRALIAGCLQSWTAIWNTIANCLAPLLPSQLVHPSIQMTPQQEAEWHRLQSRAHVAYNPEDQAHAEALKQLWSLTYPRQPFQLPSEQWKTMGWQGTNPATDFRSGGLLALQNLLYLAEQKPELYHTLLHKSNGDRAQDLPLDQGGRGGEYPFAAAGVNITHMLTEMLGLQDKGTQQSSGASQGFVQLLGSSEDAHVFEEVYCIAFERLDQLWLAFGEEMKGNYGSFDFNTVKKQLQQELTRQLSNRPGSLVELRTLLSL